MDYERLGAYFRVLSIGTRLEILRKLQIPRAIAEIHVPPSRDDRERDPERPIARQTIEAHLQKLEEAGLVQSRPARREGRAVSEFVLNRSRLFVLVEELRRLSYAGASSGLATAEPETNTTPEDADLVMPPGAALALAGGPFEGQAFPLEGDGPWTIGRDPECAIRLPYDPFVSGVNARLRRDGKRFFVSDLDDSKNGTRVNWRYLAAGEERALLPGDTLGVGRTLLVMRGA